MEVLIFGAIVLKMPIHFQNWGFGQFDPLTGCNINKTPKGTDLH